MVPTLTMFGRVSECTLLDSKLGAAAVEVTQALWPGHGVLPRPGWVVLPRFRARPVRPVPTLDTIGGVNPVPEQVTVLVYSNSADLRANVRTAVGRRPAPDVGRIEWVECPTQADMMRELDQGGIDLAIVDGEAQPTGGMGLARQFKYELDDCPPIVVLIARPQDGWLASWSLADAVINTPIEPVESAAVVAEQLRRRVSGIPVVR
jgi:hypothetical protein